MASSKSGHSGPDGRDWANRVERMHHFLFVSMPSTALGLTTAYGVGHFIFLILDRPPSAATLSTCGALAISAGVNGGLASARRFRRLRRP
ncbi:hypothetical protein FHX45_000657 [Amycolatopsis granulosa]|nr:hypothetical protein [Amycolatopsis granulosa]